MARDARLLPLDVRRQGQFPRADARFLPSSRPHDAASRACGAVPAQRADSSPVLCCCGALRRCTAATGAPPSTSRDCISKRAITRASSIACAKACSASSPARRASTSSRADSCRRRRNRSTGSPMRDFARDRRCAPSRIASPRRLSHRATVALALRGAAIHRTVCVGALADACGAAAGAASESTSAELHKARSRAGSTPAASV